MAQTRPMRVLFVWPICRFSVWDVARGYRVAMGKLLGEDNIRDYFLDKHTAYHRRAMPVEASSDVSVLSKFASESILNEALYFSADIVLVVSGLNFHPIGLWLLNKAHIPAAVLFTESPYEDVNQAEWASTYPGMLCMANDLASADKYGWDYVPHSFDPTIHHPTDTIPGSACDVVMVGTGWKERMTLLEGVDWTGINLKLYGIWPDLTQSSPIYRYHTSAVIDNEKISQVYCAAKICINHHRDGSAAGARSLGPRAFEIAASGAFQISDYREELDDVFGDTVPVYSNPSELEGLIRYYLDRDQERKSLASMAHERVAYCTFDRRVSKMIDSMVQHINMSKPHEVIPFRTSSGPSPAPIMSASY